MVRAGLEAQMNCVAIEKWFRLTFQGRSSCSCSQRGLFQKRNLESHLADEVEPRQVFEESFTYSIEMDEYSVKKIYL